MKRLLVTTNCIAFVFLTYGCAYRYVFTTGLEPSKTKIVKEWKHIGLWGWIEVSPFDLNAACPEGVAEFGSYISFPNWLCALTTAGLYSPRTAYAIPVRGLERELTLPVSRSKNSEPHSDEGELEISARPEPGSQEPRAENSRTSKTSKMDEISL